MPVNGPTVADLTGGLTAERPAMGLVREAAFLSFDDSPVRVAVRLLLRHKAIEAPVRGTVGRSGTAWSGLSGTRQPGHLGVNQDLMWSL